ncbi:hypothetical protein [Acinetobacter bohemicus]|uniref:hypothetical protein n=1 Tax=Acinetobacter bohemicus TaxID=1435036 RepID=UPI003FA20E4E
MNKVIYSLGASVFSKLIILLINIISFRYILPDEYGFIALVLALTATIGAVSNMGASVAVNSFVAKNQNTNLSKLYVKYNYILSTFLSLFLSTLVFFLSVDRQGNINDLGVYLFLLLFTLFSAYNSISEAVLNGMKGFDKIFKNNLINFFIFLPVSIFFIYQFSVLGVFLSLILYRFSLFIFNFYSAKKILSIQATKISKSDLSIIKSSFRNLTFPVIFSGILVAPVIGFSFKLMSSQQDGYENLAYFNIIYQMYLVAVFIPNALNGYLISKFSSENGEKDFSKIAKYNIGFSIIVAVMLFLFKDLYFYIIDSKNDVIINNFYIMLLTIIFFSVNAIFASLWPSVNRAWFGMWMNLIWAITLLSVTYILSSQNVAESLAWGFLTSYLILTIVQILFYKVVNSEKI